MENNEVKKRTKVTREGEQCRDCGTPVVKLKSKDKPRGLRAYYFEYYLLCPKSGCRKIYLHPESKMFWPESSN